MKRESGLTIFFVSVLFIGAPHPTRADGEGAINFRLVGPLPTDAFSTISLEYLTCENHSGNLTMEKSQDWQSLNRPLSVKWSEGKSCVVTAKVEDNRNDYRYYGSITCAVSNGTTVDCKVPLCRQIDVGPPQCH